MWVGLPPEHGKLLAANSSSGTLSLLHNSTWQFKTGPHHPRPKTLDPKPETLAQVAQVALNPEVAQSPEQSCALEQT